MKLRLMGMLWMEHRMGLGGGDMLVFGLSTTPPFGHPSGGGEWTTPPFGHPSGGGEWTPAVGHPSGGGEWERACFSSLIANFKFRFIPF